MLLISLGVSILFTLFLAGKDAVSYLLKDNSVKGPLVDSRISTWHIDGFFIDAIFIAVLAYAGKNWWILLQATLIRLGIFNVAFNYWANLKLSYFGITAITDKISAKIFGQNGAVIQGSIFVFLAIILTVYLKWL